MAGGAEGLPAKLENRPSAGWRGVGQAAGRHLHPRTPHPSILPCTRSALSTPLSLFPVAFPHSFAAGDVVLIQPENSASHTQQFCQVLGLDPDQNFTLLPRDPGEHQGPGEVRLRPPVLPVLRGSAGVLSRPPCATPHRLLLPPAGVSCPARLPQPCSVRHLVSHYLDIASVPRRSFFELLACLSPHELEREKLLHFSSPQGQEELYSYCSRPRRTILEV